jgi:membrane protease YdiL (CAAX protease family)
MITNASTWRGRLTWQRIPVTAMRIDRPHAEARFWLAYSVGFFLASILTGWLIRAHPRPLFGAIALTQDIVYVFFFKLLLLLAVPLAVFRRSGYRLRDLTPAWRPGARTLIAVVVAYGLGFAINAGHLAGQAAARPEFGATEFGLRVVLSPVVAFLMAGFPEEFVFRGVLQTRLEAVWGRVAGIGLTLVLFTAWHIPPRYFNATGVEGQAGDLRSVLLGTGLPVAIVALIFGLVWDRYRSFWPLVAAHTGVDTLPIISSFLGVTPTGR